MKKTFLLIGVDPGSILNFRADLLKKVASYGFTVYTISERLNEAQDKTLRAMGIRHLEVNFSRTSLNPVLNIITLLSLAKRVLNIKSSAILAYTIKPIIFCGLISRFLHVDFHALVTGVGFSFHGSSFKRRVLTKIVVFLYTVALKQAKSIIFQNKNNRDLFIEKGIVSIDRTFIVDGSGVDLNYFSYKEVPESEIQFLCISRLIREKGLREYSEAAKIVKNRFPHVDFILLGPEDCSPDKIYLEEVESWSNYLKYKAQVDDVREYIRLSHVFVLPSYHEGIPRSTLEAMSIGRPILTTDAVGCRETVVEGVNGFKVPVGSVEALVEKMVWFIENREKIQSMGLSSLKIVKERFDVVMINEKMLRIMDIS